MKKIFTLAAAVLASFSLWAADPVVIALPSPTVDGGNDVYTYSSASEIKVKNVDAVWFEIPSDVKSGDFYIKGSGENKDRFLYIHKDNGDTRDESRKIVFKKEYGDPFLFTAGDIKSDGGKYYLVFSTGDDYKMKGECAKLSVASTPVVDPVSKVTVAGEDACYLGQSVNLAATPDVKATAYKWSVNGVDQEGATSATFEFTAAAAGSFDIVCSAKNDLNADWVASDAHKVVVTEKILLPQVDVTGSIVWDWTKAGPSELLLTDKTMPKKNEESVLANVDGINNDENFKSQALVFKGEYAVRNGKLCQGYSLKFKTTVAGFVSVEYSNTGNRTKEDDRRFLTVNGVKIGDGSMSSSTTTTEYNIAVEAGDVVLAGLLKKDDSEQYLQFYRIEFSTEKVPTAIDNAQETVKATKVIRNGQLLIEKNGVLFNAQGTVVK